MKMSNLFHRQVIVALLFCPLLLVAMHTLHFDRRISQSNGLNAEYELTPPFFKFISSGFWPAAADAFWIQTLQLTASSNYSEQNLNEAKSFYRLATDLDPKFYELYEQGGVLFSFFFENPEAAREILQKGIDVSRSPNLPEKYWTHPATLYILLAYTYAFQMNDWANAKRVYLEALQAKGCPEYIFAMKPWLESENSERILALKVLTNLIRNTTDEKMKAQYQEKLKLYE
jgi:hypothetical protein